MQCQRVAGQTVAHADVNVNVDEFVYGTRSVKQLAKLPQIASTPLLEEVKRWSMEECHRQVQMVQAVQQLVTQQAEVLDLMQRYDRLVQKYAAAQRRLAQGIQSGLIDEQVHRHRALYLENNPLRCIRRQLKEAVYFFLGCAAAAPGSLQYLSSESKLRRALETIEL